MGQARKRGSFETRSALAKEKQLILDKKHREDMLEAEKRMTPRERAESLEKAKAMAMLFGMTGPEGWDYLTRTLR
jgi:hypothetical protein